MVSIRMHVLSLHVGKAAFPAWIRVDSWLPARPTASPWTTALGWWTPRRPPTAWRPIWWTAQQVTLAAPCFRGLPSPSPLLLVGVHHWECGSNPSRQIICGKGGNTASLGYLLHLLSLRNITFYVNYFIHSVFVWYVDVFQVSLEIACKVFTYTKLSLSLDIIGRSHDKVCSLCLLVVEISIKIHISKEMIEG